MSNSTSIPSQPIRLLFELERADNPRLYDDLVRFKKGTKRVNRLRTLAQEGLLAQHWPTGFVLRVAGSAVEAAPHDTDDAAITNQVFGPPITE